MENHGKLVYSVDTFFCLFIIPLLNMATIIRKDFWKKWIFLKLQATGRSVF